MATKPLVVIVGPTASGKTSLAIEVAKQFDGEIICADSRTIYRGMDIGTAKPTLAERTEVRHWGLDLVEPGDHFTAYDFKQYATAKIEEIRSRGHIPLLVGGTGLYIDAVVFDYHFGQRPGSSLRAKFQLMTIDELHNYCYKNNVTLPENSQNKRYLIRAIERNNVQGKRREAPIDNTIIVGITTERDVLRQRIVDRSEHIFDDGVVDEATSLGNVYGWDNEAMTGNIYPLVHQYLQNVIDLNEAKRRFIVLDWRLAKRQMTWLRRNKYIRWLDLQGAKQYLMDHLAKE